LCLIKHHDNKTYGRKCRSM